jgi:hypothetical protein
VVKDSDNGKMTEIHYVDSKDVPTIMFHIFVGQEDEVRIDAAKLLEKVDNVNNNHEIIEHIID